MPITIGWDNEEHTVIRYDFEGEWSKPEVLERLIEVKAMMSTVEHTVDVIINMQGSHTPTGELLRLGRRILMPRPPDNMGLIVVAGANDLVKGLVDISRKVYQRWTDVLVVVDTLDAARTFIAARRDQEIAGSSA